MLSTRYLTTTLVQHILKTSYVYKHGSIVEPIPFILVNAFLIIMSMVTGDGWSNFWEWQTYNTAIFWGIGIVFHAFNVFGMKFLLGNDWEERKIKEIMDKDKKDFWE